MKRDTSGERRQLMRAGPFVTSPFRNWRLLSIRNHFVGQFIKMDTMLKLRNYWLIHVTYNDYMQQQ